MTFDLVWRNAGGETVLATWMQHWEPLPGGSFKAQPYEIDVESQAIDFTAGDQLVFRYSGANTSTAMAFIPNGDGALADGRIPNITLPR